MTVSSSLCKRASQAGARGCRMWRREKRSTAIGRFASVIGLSVINTQTDSLDSILDMTDRMGADVAIECGGSRASLEQCITFTRKAAQLVAVGLPGREIEVDLDQVIIKELTILPSFTYRHETWTRALELLDKGTIRTTPLVSRRFPLTEWQTAFDTVRSRQGIKCLLLPMD